MKLINIIGIKPLKGLSRILSLAVTYNRWSSLLIRNYFSPTQTQNKIWNGIKMRRVILLFLTVSFYTTTLTSCWVTYWGKSPVRLDNDEIQLKIYWNAFANQKLIDAKLMQGINKELSENNYSDYKILNKLDGNPQIYNIKFYRSIQDKLASINSIQGQISYLDSLIDCPNGKYNETAKQLLIPLKEKELAQLKEKEIKSKAMEMIIKERPENYKKLKIGMTPKEIVSLLAFEEIINSTRFGGLFVGIGLLPKAEQNTKESYSGNAVFEGYSFTFLNGQLTEWHIIESETGSKTYHGSCTNEHLGTTTKWSVNGDKYNIEVKPK